MINGHLGDSFNHISLDRYQITIQDQLVQHKLKNLEYFLSADSYISSLIS